MAMVMLGIANSRMKDFYDLWMLARRFAFDGATLCQAIRATFDRRQTALPETTPLALTPEFHGDTKKQAQWRAFIDKGKLVSEPITLESIASLLQMFLMPPTDSLAADEEFARAWAPDGPWTEA